MAELIVYSSKAHPHCELLRDVLKKEGIAFREVSIQNPDAVAELRENGCLALEPPVIQVAHDPAKRVFFTNDDLFWDGELIREAVIDLARHFSVRVTRSRGAA